MSSLADIDKIIIVDDNEKIENVALEAILKGDSGITPTIGQNGNWYLGDTDTGKPSRGENGTNGTNRFKSVRMVLTDKTEQTDLVLLLL